MGEPFHLSASLKAALLEAAHEAIRCAVDGEDRANATDEAEDVWTAEDGAAPGYASGVFVSVYVAGELRGCLGTWALDGSLVGAVRRMAAAAATLDQRFRPLALDELEGTAVEISLVGVPRPASALGNWGLGEQGLTVARGEARGVLLPQVAFTHRLDRRRFLEATCAKAGLAEDAWREPETVLMAFDAEVFGDQWTPPSHWA